MTNFVCPRFPVAFSCCLSKEDRALSWDSSRLLVELELERFQFGRVGVQPPLPPERILPWVGRKHSVTTAGLTGEHLGNAFWWSLIKTG